MCGTADYTSLAICLGRLLYFSIFTTFFVGAYALRPRLAGLLSTAKADC